MKKNYKTVPELKKLCKEKGIKNYSKLNRAELLIKCFQQKGELPVQTKYSTYKVKELKALCKERKIKGYSKCKTKAELIEKLESAPVEKYDKEKLLSICKEKKVKGCSKLSLDELIELSLKKDVPEALKKYKVDELRKLCKEKNIPVHNKMKKAELMQKCFEYCFGSKYNEQLWNRVPIPGDHHCGFHAFLYAMDSSYPEDPKLPSKEIPYKDRILDLKKIVIEGLKNGGKDEYKNVILDPVRWMEDHDLYILANYFDVCICVYESDHEGILPIVFNTILPVEYDKKTIADCSRKIYLYHTGDHFDTLFPKSVTLDPGPVPNRLTMSSEDIFNHSLSILSKEDIDELEPQLQSVDSSIQYDGDSQNQTVFPEQQELLVEEVTKTPDEGQIIETPEQGQIIETPEQGQIIETPQQEQVIIETPQQGKSEVQQKKTKKRQSQKKTSPPIKTVPMFSEDYEMKEKMVRNVIEKCFAKYRVPDYLLTK